LGKWNFADLRAKLEYKALLNGVKMIIINPAYTSQTCSICKHIGKRINKHFECKNCGNDMDADINASRNISALGAIVNSPFKKSNNMCCSISHSYSGLKPVYIK
jgi:transposase